MSYLNTTKELIEQLIYDIRYEYTGYINSDNLIKFANDVMMPHFQGISNQLPDDAASLTFPQLKVVTDDLHSYGGYQYKPIAITDNKYGNDGKVFSIPKMKYGVGTTLIGGLNYPNIMRLLTVHVLDADLDNVADNKPEDDPGFDQSYTSEKVKLVGKNALDALNRNYYRKPSERRIYAVILGENEDRCTMHVTTDKDYLLLEYLTFPEPLTDPTSTTVLKLSETHLIALKQDIMVKFLERINDNRFKNFIQQKGK